MFTYVVSWTKGHDMNGFRNFEIHEVHLEVIWCTSVFVSVVDLDHVCFHLWCELTLAL